MDATITLPPADENFAFLFVVSQAGAEGVCKSAIQTRFPEFRFSFSRPGFLTFKIPGSMLATCREDLKVDLEVPFARTYGLQTARVQGGDEQQRAERFWQHWAQGNSPTCIHVWQRDTAPVGDMGFEPEASPLAQHTAELLIDTCPESVRPNLLVNRVARAGARVLDVVLVEPDSWWIGQHLASQTARRWVGGVPFIQRPEPMISRAYLKLQEALLWSGIRIRPGELCAEIGSSPGGAAQLLLEQGAKVIGIDPAEMDPRILEHPNFVHIRKRGRDVQRRDFAQVKWLFSDSNVSPKQTLDTLEDIVVSSRTSIRGLLITIKLPQWKLATQLPEFMERVRSWGFQYVKPRHLAYNRQEICVCAMRHKALRRFS